MAFCVGGGSRVPTLSGKLARRFGLTDTDVASVGRVALKNLIVDEDGIDGPEGVTVVGIAAVAMKSLGQKLITIKIDGKEYSLFKNRELNVGAALSLLDFDPKDLIGQNGKDIKFTLNGGSEIVYGGIANAAEIFINGSKVSLQTTIGDRDEISIYRASNGVDAKAFVGDYLKGSGQIQVTIDGEPKTIQSLCQLNGLPAKREDELSDEDVLEIKEITTAGELLAILGLPQRTIIVNDKPVGASYILRENDQIITTPPEQPVVAAEEPLQALSAEKSLAPVETAGAEAAPGDELASEISVTINGAIVHLSGKKSYFFLEALNHIEVNLTRISRIPVLRLNGVQAGYTDLLADGDVLEIILK
jgi:sulfur carrier protein ThiS